MTNIEIQTMEAVKSASRNLNRHIDSLHNVDNLWEQRFYNTANTILASLASTQWNVDEDVLVEKSVRLANKLIDYVNKTNTKQYGT